MRRRLLEGRDLLSVLKARSRPLAEADVRIIAQRVLAALQALHAAGRNHGNVKSNNVGLMEKGDYRTTVIFDWETSQLGAWLRLLRHILAALAQLTLTAIPGPARGDMLPVNGVASAQPVRSTGASHPGVALMSTLTAARPHPREGYY